MPDETTTVAALRQQVRAFVAERQWERYHDPKNLAMSIAIEAAELMEHFQWLRSDELTQSLAEPNRRTEVAHELADVFCYVLALANVLKLDLSDTLAEKMVRNVAKYPAEQFRGQWFKPANPPAAD